MKTAQEIAEEVAKLRIDSQGGFSVPNRQEFIEMLVLAITRGRTEERLDSAATCIDPWFGALPTPQYFTVRDLCLAEGRPTFARRENGELRVVALVDGEHTEYTIDVDGGATKEVFDPYSFGWVSFRRVSDNGVDWWAVER